MTMLHAYLIITWYINVAGGGFNLYCLTQNNHNFLMSVYTSCMHVNCEYKRIQLDYTEQKYKCNSFVFTS